jgi:hypothetical protein
MGTQPMALDRSLNLPGLSVTVGEIMGAVDQVRQGASALVVRKPDQAIADIVGGWPAGFTATRARALGFSPNEGLVELVRAFVAEDLEPTRRDRGLT